MIFLKKIDLYIYHNYLNKNKQPTAMNIVAALALFVKAKKR